MFDLDVKVVSPEVLKKRVAEEFVIYEVSEEKEETPARKREMKAERKRVPVHMKKPKIEPRMLKRFKSSEFGRA